MPDTLRKIRELVVLERVRLSDHGFEEMLEDDISIELILLGIQDAAVVEDYPDASRGPSVLTLQVHANRPVHVVWGLARNRPDIATLVTAYFPDSEKWYDGFLKRKPR